MKKSLPYGCDQNQGARGLPTRELDYESCRTRVLSLKSHLLLPLLELPQVPATSHCRRCWTWTLEIQLNSCSTQKETTGLKGPPVHPKIAFIFIAVLLCNEGPHKPGEESQQIHSTGFEIWRLQFHQDFLNLLLKEVTLNFFLLRFHYLQNGYNSSV